MRERRASVSDVPVWLTYKRGLRRRSARVTCQCGWCASMDKVDDMLTWVA